MVKRNAHISFRTPLALRATDIVASLSFVVQSKGRELKRRKAISIKTLCYE